MQAFRPAFLAFLALGSVALSACLQSRRPLFDEAKAVTPAPAGRYEEQENKYGNWVRKQAGTLTLENRSYNWKVDSDQEAIFFTLYDVGSGFYVAAARNKNPTPKDSYTYALFEASKAGFLAYTPTCSDMMQMRHPKEDLPAVDGSDCFYTDREALVRSLKRYAAVMLPASRYVPLNPSGNK
jgi:hypothetical protein